MSSSRQLAAIMFTDIVGYASLMGQDEQRTLEVLRKNRDIQRPIISQNDGRWIKELGDGVMATFGTVSDAVNAAVRIQEACLAGNDFQLRIGIHLGEVVFEGDDVFGDGVNIAARIQTAAKAGSIYVSEAVHHNIANKKEFKTRFVREELLKNVESPVRIYEIVSNNESSIEDTTTNQQSNPGAGNSSPLQQRFENVVPLPNRARRIIIAVLLFLPLLIAGLYTFSILNKTEVPEDVLDKSIAVLPFVDMTPQVTWNTWETDWPKKLLILLPQSVN